MLAEVVLVTRILGLVTGGRVIEAQVEPHVQAVEIVLDGRPAGTMHGPPWRARVDFGPELAPHELTAIARNEHGNEVGRDTQFINLARPRAELDVMFSRRGGKLFADLTWQHIGASPPARMTARLDGKTIAKKVAKSIALPAGDAPAIRILDVEVVFKDGSKARREVAFGGVYSEKLPAELTATIVRQRVQGREDLERCFLLDGAFVPAEAVDAGEAVVVFVRSVDPFDAKQALLTVSERENRSVRESDLVLPDTTLRYVWPVADRDAKATLFFSSREYEAARGVRWFLTRISGPQQWPQRLIDAATVAGSESLRDGRRRAVVVVLGKEVDNSTFSADAVKRYLARIGVPLHVWSLTGGRTHPVWGEVEDVSTAARLRDAVSRLRIELEKQRIAWLPLDPYRALRVQTASDCAWTKEVSPATAAVPPAAP